MKQERVHFRQTSQAISDFKKKVSNSPAIKFIIAPQYDDFENIVPTPIIIDDNPQPLRITYLNPGDFI